MIQLANQISRTAGNITARVQAREALAALERGEGPRRRRKACAGAARCPVSQPCTLAPACPPAQNAQLVAEQDLCPTAVCLNLDVMEHLTGDQTCFCDPGVLARGVGRHGSPRANACGG